MLISQNMNAALNRQVGSELGASNQYLHIAAFFENESLPALAGFFFRQSDEERAHALRIVHYTLDAGGSVAVPAIEAAPTGITGAETAVQMALDWELEVTQQINGLMDLAMEENDHMTQQFLRWFVEEQLEEVSTMEELLGIVRRAGESGLLLVEQYVAHMGDPHDEEGEE